MGGRADTKAIIAYMYVNAPRYECLMDTRGGEGEEERIL